MVSWKFLPVSLGKSMMLNWHCDVKSADDEGSWKICLLLAPNLSMSSEDASMEHQARSYHNCLSLQLVFDALLDDPAQVVPPVMRVKGLVHFDLHSYPEIRPPHAFQQHSTNLFSSYLGILLENIHS